MAQLCPALLLPSTFARERPGPDRKLDVLPQSTGGAELRSLSPVACDTFKLMEQLHQEVEEVFRRHHTRMHAVLSNPSTVNGAMAQRLSESDYAASHIASGRERSVASDATSNDRRYELWQPQQKHQGGKEELIVAGEALSGCTADGYGRRFSREQLAHSSQEFFRETRRKTKFSVTYSEEEAMRRDLVSRADTESQENGADSCGQTTQDGRRSSLGAKAEEHTKLWHVVHSNRFQLTFCLLILGNAAFFGIEAEYVTQHNLSESPLGFQICNSLFSLIFAVEWILRLIADGKTFFMEDEDRGWNFLDTVLVGLSFAELLAMLLNGGGKGASSLSLVRLVRSLRLVRIIRIIRVLRFFRSLRLLIMAVVNTIKSLIWTMLLLLMLLYLFAVLFTQAAHSHMVDETDASLDFEKLEDAWGSVPRSVYSLFKSITNGTSWELVAEPLGNVDGIWLALFLLYIAFAYFAVLNVVTGVFCQMAIEGAGKDQDEVVQELMRTKQEHIAQLWSIFDALDETGQQKVTMKEFQQLVNSQRLVDFFTSLEIDVDDAWSLFKLLDTSGDGEVDVDEFVTGCLKLRGQARSVDLALLQYQVKWLTQRFTSFCLFAEDALSTPAVFRDRDRSLTSDLHEKAALDLREVDLELPPGTDFTLIRV